MGRCLGKRKLKGEIMEEEKEYTCFSCGAMFNVIHNCYDDVTFCPFCGDDDVHLNDDEEEDDD